MTLKLGNVLPLLVLQRKTNLNKFRRGLKAVHSRWNALYCAKRIADAGLAQSVYSGC